MKEPHWHLQRVLLSLLEEAGEEDVVCLLRTLHVSHDSKMRVEDVVGALTRLRARGMCTTGSARDAATGKWTEHDHATADELIAKIPLAVDWYGNDWRWLPGQEEFSILLTDNGMNEARRVLEQAV